MTYGLCDGGGGPFFTKNDCDNIFFKNIAFRNKTKTPVMLLPDDCDCVTYSFEVTHDADVTVKAPPSITQISPVGSIRNTTVSVEFQGNNLQGGSNPTVNVSGEGVTTTFDAYTQNGFQAFFQIAANAELGNRNVTVTKNGLTSNAVQFTIGDTTPVITSISQDEGTTGETLSITINGNHFGLNPLVEIDGTGVFAAVNQGSSTNTQIQATFTIDEETYPGNRNITVKSRGQSGTGFIQTPEQTDTSNAVPFSVIAIEATFSANPETVFPSNLLVDRNSESILLVCTQPATSNLNVTFELSIPEDANYGGHVNAHHTGQRPRGKIDRLSGRTGNTGCFSTTYTGSHIAGEVRVTARVAGKIGTEDIMVGFPDFVELPPGTSSTNYDRTGALPEHPSNIWGTQAAITGMVNIANEFKARYYGNSRIPQNEKIVYNDASLPYGGKFDIAKNWLNTGDHAEHREGINDDVRCCRDPGNIPRDRWETLKEIFRRNGSTRTNDETGSAKPHWHLRFEFNFNNNATQNNISQMQNGIESNPGSMMEVGSINNTPHEFIESVHSAILARESNQKDYEYWMDKLEKAKLQGQNQLSLESKTLIRQLFNSAEYYARQRTNQEFIEDVFWTYLSRSPSDREIKFWMDRFGSIDSNSQITKQEKRLLFLDSFEDVTDSQSVVSNFREPVKNSEPNQ